MEIRVYRFSKAPEEFKVLSTHGGDEEDVIVGYLPGVEPISAEDEIDFDNVVERLDRWCSYVRKDWVTYKGCRCVVAITAHA